MRSDIGLRIACALCHLIEFNSTGEPADLQAYEALLNEPDVKDWNENNQIMLPLRRDGAPQLLPRNQHDKETASNATGQKPAR